MKKEDETQKSAPPPESDGDDHDWNRRDFLKTLPAAYIAPATLMLVTADRVAAQSRCTEKDVTLINNTGPDTGPTRPVTVGYVDNLGSQSFLLDSAKYARNSIRACLNTTITFSASAPFRVTYLLCPSSGQTGVAGSHSFTVGGDSCQFLMQDPPPP